MTQQILKPGISRRIAVAGLMAFTFFLASSGQAQVKYTTTGSVKVVIKGTSNIHDWDMKSDKGSSNAVFSFSGSGTPTGVTLLNFSTPAESLKSEHAGMDKNAYKAMKTDKYANITFSATSGSIHAAGGNRYVLTVPGKLTISGVTKEVELTANGTMAQDKSIAWSGSYKLKMTDYNVTPPSIMFGTIKTGNDIVVDFNLTLKSL